MRSQRIRTGATATTLPTLNQYFEQFSDRQIWSPSTRRSVDLTIRSCRFASRPLDEIRRSDVQTWVKSMVDASLAATTVRTRFKSLNTVLAGAVLDDVIQRNPCIGVRTPAPMRRQVQIVLPDPITVATVVAVAPTPLGTTVALAAWAGLRLGEARGLRWSDVNPASGVITVRQQVQSSPGGGWALVPPKAGSERSITLDPRLAELLASRGHDVDPQIWVVPGHSGGPVHPGTLTRQWHSAKVQHGLDARLRLHDLRHLYASTLIAAGADVVSVQMALGHARASTTLDVYAHALRSNPFGWLGNDV
ncbi:tyrosine-type recombinase/integrase [Cellulomonas sp. Leaf395]|uniref:tyrosine-type recombinase/integrase n=1 Tax=Cellulomonas sp. Leaf395 TaxID=1736362 RepID=UPI000AE6EE3B|nr:site-specific integrase [Cellulomonas sp. Leaf395]